LSSHRPEEAPNPPGASHRVTSEPLKKEQEAQLLLGDRAMRKHAKDS